jgi:hypothetical protein
MDSDLFYVEDVEGADIFEVLPAQPAAPVAAAAASTIPQSLWGFDPLHFTHVRLFITTLLKLELFPDSGTFSVGVQKTRRPSLVNFLYFLPPASEDIND